MKSTNKFVVCSSKENPLGYLRPKSTYIRDEEDGVYHDEIEKFEEEREDDYEKYGY